MSLPAAHPKAPLDSPAAKIWPSLVGIFDTVFSEERRSISKEDYMICYTYGVVFCSHTSRSLISAASQKSINAAKGSHGTSSGELYERLRDYVVFQCSTLSKVWPLPPGLMKGVRFSFGGGIAFFLQEALGYVLLFQQSVSQPLQLCEPILR